MRDPHKQVGLKRVLCIYESRADLSSTQSLKKTLLPLMSGSSFRGRWLPLLFALVCSLAGRSSHARITSASIQRDDRRTISLSAHAFGFEDGGQLAFTLKNIQLHKPGSNDVVRDYKPKKLGFYLSSKEEDPAVEDEFGADTSCILDSKELENNKLPSFQDSYIRLDKQASMRPLILHGEES